MDYSYLAGSEGDPIAELHSLFLLPVVEPLPADADCHRAQVLIKPEIVLMLWGSMEKDENLKPEAHEVPVRAPDPEHLQRCETCYSCHRCIVYNSESIAAPPTWRVCGGPTLAMIMTTGGKRKG